MTIGISGAMAGASLITAISSLGLNWRQRYVQHRDAGRLRDEMDRGHVECLAEIGKVGMNLEISEKNAQSSLELLQDGRLGVPARARALRMLRSGVAPETTASELGMARSEVRLLEKIAALLTPR